MTRKLIGILAFCFLSTCAVAPASADWPVSAMNTAIDQTNFAVNKGCSGTLIDIENRYILTAAHCVGAQYATKEREKIDENGVITKEKYRKLIDGSVSQLVLDSGTTAQTTTYRVALKAVDKDNDLAVVQVVGKLPNTLAARLAEAEPRRGDKVYVVGNPAGLYTTVHAGIVSSVERSYGLIDFGDQTRERLMQVSAGIIGGNSGGAVYNADGELVGVPVIGHRSNEVLGFAVPLDVIKEFLKANSLSAPEGPAHPW